MQRGPGFTKFHERPVAAAEPWQSRRAARARVGVGPATQEHPAHHVYKARAAVHAAGETAPAACQGRKQAGRAHGTHARLTVFFIDTDAAGGSRSVFCTSSSTTAHENAKLMSMKSLGSFCSGPK